MRMKFRLALVIVSLCAAAAASTAEALDPAQRGREIAEAARDRDRGWTDSASQLEMILGDQTGRTSSRKMRIMVLQANGGGEDDKSLVIFDEPRDVAGTALLSFSRPAADDDQWLYLPSLRKTKRISSSSRSGSFLGSQFSYEDMTPVVIEDYAYKWLRDEACGELMCHVIERIPTETGTGYSRQEVWFDTGELRILKVNFFDRRGELLKTLTREDFRQHPGKQGRYWRAHRQIMHNQQTNEVTTLILEREEFDTGQSWLNFTPDRLGRVL